MEKNDLISVIGIFGGGLFIVGCFFPLLKIPVVGTLTIFSVSFLAGIIFLLIGGLGIALYTINERYSFLIGATALIGIFGLFFYLNSMMAYIAKEFGFIGKSAISTVSFDVAWGFFILGMIFLCSGIFFDNKQKPSPLIKNPEIQSQKPLIPAVNAGPERNDEAINTIRLLYAKGEISKEEYEERLKMLKLR